MSRTKLHAANLSADERLISTSGYLRRSQPYPRDDISARGARLELDAHGHVEVQRNTHGMVLRASEIMEETSGRARNDPHKLTPTPYPPGRHANPLSYCTPRRISRRAINFMRANRLGPISWAHCARFERPIPLIEFRIPDGSLAWTDGHWFSGPFQILLGTGAERRVENRRRFGDGWRYNCDGDPFEYSLYYIVGRIEV